MRQPNTYHIREFVNRGQNIANNGLMIDKDTISNVTKELVDILAYIMQLENEIADLKEKATQNEVITVEMIGDNF